MGFHWAEYHKILVHKNLFALKYSLAIDWLIAAFRLNQIHAVFSLIDADTCCNLYLPKQALRNLYQSTICKVFISWNSAHDSSSFIMVAGQGKCSHRDSICHTHVCDKYLHNKRAVIEFHLRIDLHNLRNASLRVSQSQVVVAFHKWCFYYPWQCAELVA